VALWKQLALILAVALVGAGVTGSLVEVPAPPSRDPFAMSAADVPEGVVWVDARSAEAFAGDHIPGALNVSLEAWEAGFFALMERWVPGAPVVVYCSGESCALSREVAERLRAELGAEQVYWLEGGIDAWKEAHP